MEGSFSSDLWEGWFLEDSSELHLLCSLFLLLLHQLHLGSSAIRFWRSGTPALSNGSEIVEQWGDTTWRSWRFCFLVFLMEDCLKWIIHPLWASVFSSLKWKCWARGCHGPNTLCLGDRLRLGPFQPCFAFSHNVQQNLIILPNGYSQFSVPQSFVWKKNCSPTLVLLLSSWCYSKKRERDKALWKVDPCGLLSRFAVWSFS